MLLAFALVLDARARARRVRPSSSSGTSGEQAGRHDRRDDIYGAGPGRPHRLRRRGPALRRGGRRHPARRGGRRSPLGRAVATTRSTAGAGPDRLAAGLGHGRGRRGPGGRPRLRGETDAAVDSIDCGDGFDRVVRNNGDRVFNCEDVRRLHGPRPPGSVRMGTPDVDDQLDDTDWNGSDLILGLAGDDYLNGHAGGDILWGNEDDDILDGDTAPTLLLGGPGDDLLMGKGRERSPLGRLRGGRRSNGGDDDDELDLDRGGRRGRSDHLRERPRPRHRATGRRRSQISSSASGSSASRAKPYGGLTERARVPHSAVVQCVRTIHLAERNAREAHSLLVSAAALAVLVAAPAASAKVIVGTAGRRHARRHRRA